MHVVATASILRKDMSISETDKIVAAVLASAKATAAGATTAEDYIAEYQGFLYHFEMQGQIELEQTVVTAVHQRESD